MTEPVCRVNLPFPPSVNTLYPTVIIGSRHRRVPSKRYQAWRDEAVLRLRLAKLPRFGDRVTLRLLLHAPDRRARDADNYLKAPIDALVTAGIIQDDKLVSGIQVSWASPPGLPGVEIEIEAAPGGGATCAAGGRAASPRQTATDRRATD